MATPAFLEGATVICWHVDYWDYLGWPDPFAKPEFTQRQRRYKELRNPKQMGTPQFVIENEVLPWEEGAFARIPDLVARGGERDAAFTLSARAVQVADRVIVSAQITSLGDEDIEGVVVRPVLLQRRAETTVSKGENAGRTLTEFLTALATMSCPAADAIEKSMSFHFPLDGGLTADDVAVALLVEREDELRTLDSWLLNVDVPPGLKMPSPDAGYIGEAFHDAGDNREQLVLFMMHYPEGTQEEQAARFLVANMPGKGYVVTELRDEDANRIEFDPLAYATFAESRAAIEALEKEHGELDFAREGLVEDVKTITADFLIRHTDGAFAAWRAQPESRRVDFTTFLNHVLPYRGSEEPLDDWMSALRARNAEILGDLPAGADAAEIYRRVNKDASARVRFNERYYLHPTDQGFGEMLASGQGRCEDITNMITYAARSAALATAADYTPWWAHRDNNHAWNVLLDREGRGCDKAQSHAAKVYRKTFAIQRDALKFQLPPGREAPNRFLSSDTSVDVTDQYRETTDLAIGLDPLRIGNERFAYICVFNGGEWKAIHWAPVADSAAAFTKMGRDICYAPAVHDGESLIPAAAPLIVATDGRVRTLDGGDTTTSLIATSVMPRQKSADTGEETPVSHLTEGTTYVLKRWADGAWQDVAEVVTGAEPLQFDDLPADSLYWLVAKESRRLERIFTIEDGRQRFW